VTEFEYWSVRVFGKKQRSDKMIVLTWNRDGDDLECMGEHYFVSCKVRNEIDLMNVRRLHDKKEVVKTIQNGVYMYPYMPRKFPKGRFEITSYEKTTDPVFAPIKIKTNAVQMVEKWELDENGGYAFGTGKMVSDSGYYLHWSKNSLTTHGCGRVGTNTDKQILKLAGVLMPLLDKGTKIYLDVI
jgi:hypothetical protein